ncbi:MAG: glycine cleavage system aminomethyltransferase GcvT [Saprospiraceae bacterium]|jgi:aminomethyltransferase|nr:glycine cleavage system aminomethyltransferase GcvT [Saprospiraceae bacterium]
MENLLHTPLTAIHEALGAKMAPFAGYLMPISYSGIREEHAVVREKVGVFDVTHMGEFIVRGKQALDLVQKVTTNDASKLAIGQAQYSCLPNGEGGIVDDLLVYRLPENMCDEGEQAFLLVVNASNMQKDWDWISRHNQYDTRLINISSETGLMAVQGPKAVETLQSLTDIDLSAIPYYHFVKGTIAGVDNVLISATGYTGSGGFELYTENEHLPALWAAVFEAGAPFGIQPCGLGARDTLRLEMGYCLYGNDIDDTTSPLEAGLGWITKLKKGDFVDADRLNAQKAAGLSRKLVGFTVKDRRVPRHGYGLEDGDGNAIGVVTSGTQSPSLDIPIGMGYVSLPFASPGSLIYVNTGAKRLEAEVTTLPFVDVKA